MASSVSGTPTSLFWLPAVATTRRTRPTMAPRRSLVLVLPTLPVTANTVGPGLPPHLPGQSPQSAQGVVDRIDDLPPLAERGPSLPGRQGR